MLPSILQQEDFQAPNSATSLSIIDYPPCARFSLSTALGSLSSALVFSARTEPDSTTTEVLSTIRDVTFAVSFLVRLSRCHCRRVVPGLLRRCRYRRVVCSKDVAVGGAVDRSVGALLFCTVELVEVVLRDGAGRIVGLHALLVYTVAVQAAALVRPKVAVLAALRQVGPLAGSLHVVRRAGAVTGGVGGVAAAWHSVPQVGAVRRYTIPLRARLLGGSGGGGGQMSDPSTGAIG